MSDRHNQPMQQGRLLKTTQTMRWTKEQREEGDTIEKRRVFVNFSEKDQGCGRKLIAEAKAEEDARRIAACWNACREIETERLEISVDLHKQPLLKYYLEHTIRLQKQHKADQVYASCLQSEIDDLRAEINAGQSKKASAAEAILNVAVGAGVALLAQLIFYPLFNIHIPFSADLALMGIFTVISLVRSYALRRAFNFLGGK